MYFIKLRSRISFWSALTGNERLREEQEEEGKEEREKGRGSEARG